MTTERSDKVWEIYKESLEKFDYFLLGLIGAISTYLTQNYKPGKIDFNSETLELIALLLMLGSAIEGFNKIQKAIEISKLNYSLLREQELKGSLMEKLNPRPLLNTATGEVLSPKMVIEKISECDFKIKEYDIKYSELNKSGNNSYKSRNRLLIVGFVLILISKVWSAY